MVVHTMHFMFIILLTYYNTVCILLLEGICGM